MCYFYTTYCYRNKLNFFFGNDLTRCSSLEGPNLNYLITMMIHFFEFYLDVGLLQYAVVTACFRFRLPRAHDPVMSEDATTTVSNKWGGGSGGLNK